MGLPLIKDQSRAGRNDADNRTLIGFAGQTHGCEVAIFGNKDDQIAWLSALVGGKGFGNVLIAADVDRSATPAIPIESLYCINFALSDYIGTGKNVASCTELA